MNPINKIEIPDWWAEVLDRIGLPHNADNWLPVANPFDDDSSNMNDFWEELDDELGGDVEDWVYHHFAEDTLAMWQSTWSKTNFILAYMNAYSRPLFDVVETGESIFNEA
ncbi:MAG: hypothetical protein ACRCX2_38480 [Paraclostridium sp.]